MSEEAKKDAKEWIEKVLEVKLDPPNDLRKALENGVILCKLIQTIKPGMIKEYNENPKMKYKMSDNIKLFLGAVKQLGVKEPHLFEHVDLYENTAGLQKLSNCILALAYHSESKGLTKVGIPPSAQQLLGGSNLPASTPSSSSPKTTSPDGSKDSAKKSSSSSSEESSASSSGEEEEEKSKLPAKPVQSPKGSAPAPKPVTQLASPKPAPAKPQTKEEEASSSGEEESSEESSESSESDDVKPSPKPAPVKPSSTSTVPVKAKPELVKPAPAPQAKKETTKESSSSEEESSSSEGSSSEGEEDKGKVVPEVKVTSPKPALKQQQAPAKKEEEASSTSSEEEPEQPSKPAQKPPPQQKTKEEAESSSSEESSTSSEEEEEKQPVKPRPSKVPERRASSRRSVRYDPEEERRKDLYYDIRRLRQKIEDQREDRKILELKCDKLRRSIRDIRQRIDAGEFRDKVVPSVQRPPSTKEGWLERRNPDPNAEDRWQRYFFVLRDDSKLRFYKDQGQRSKRGEVDLTDTTCFAHVEKGENKSKPSYFNLRTSTGDYLLRATSKEEKTAWVSVVKPLCKGRHATSETPNTKLNRGSSFLGRVSTAQLVPPQQQTQTNK